MALKRISIGNAEGSIIVAIITLVKRITLYEGAAAARGSASLGLGTALFCVSAQVALPQALSPE
jgi:hypothetical protein